MKRHERILVSFVPEPATSLEYGRTGSAYPRDRKGSSCPWLENTCWHGPCRIPEAAAAKRRHRVVPGLVVERIRFAEWACRRG